MTHYHHSVINAYAVLHIVAILRRTCAERRNAANPALLKSFRRHNSLSAVATGNRAARMAGKKPPTKPIASAHFKPVQISSGLTWTGLKWALAIGFVGGF